MDWKRLFINWLVIGVVYAAGYTSSYFLSKRYAIKKMQKENNKDEKNKKEKK